MAMDYNYDNQYSMFSDPRYRQYIDELHQTTDGKRVQEIVNKIQDLANEYGHADEDEALEAQEQPITQDSSNFTSKAAQDMYNYDHLNMGYADTIFESPQAENVYQQQEQYSQEQIIITPTTFDNDKSIQYAKAILQGTISTDGITFQNSRQENISAQEWADGMLNQHNVSSEQFEQEIPDVQTYLLRDLAVGAYNDKPIYGQRLRFYAGDIMYTVDLETGNTSQLYDSSNEGLPYETILVEGSTTIPPKNKHIEFAEGNLVIMNGSVFWVETAPTPIPEENKQASRFGKLIRRGEQIKDNVSFFKETVGTLKREELHLEQLKRELENVKARQKENPSVQHLDHANRLNAEIRQAKTRVRKAKLNRLTSLGKTIASPFSSKVSIPEVERAYNKIQTADPVYLQYTPTPGYHPQFTRPQAPKARHQVRARAPKAK